jgi:DMSO/TMAO reductase YedYZ molybdopterin-dependent catalytic subunit
MSTNMNRRDLLRGSLASMASLAAMGIPFSALPALAQEEAVVPFLDFPANFNPNPGAGRRFFDTRTINNFITPADQFYTFQHNGQPQLDAATHKVKITGMFSKAGEITLDQIKAMRPTLEQVVAYECGGNGPRNNAQGMVSNARWKGVNLGAVLKQFGLSADAKDVVFYAADTFTEDVTHGRGTQKVEKSNFARSLTPEHAMKPEVMLAYELNGAPLTLNQGAPLRLIVPGWYGVAQVKFLTRIHAQPNRYVGKYMSRDYVTLKEVKNGDESEWVEYTVGPIQLKSVVSRVTKKGNAVNIMGFALTDLTPLKAIEVKIDDGPWQQATLDKQNTATSWKLFSYTWNNATAGEHTVVSRAIDVNGKIQQEVADPTKKTNWENPEQMPRRIMIS